MLSFFWHHNIIDKQSAGFSRPLPLQLLLTLNNAQHNDQSSHSDCPAGAASPRSVCIWRWWYPWFCVPQRWAISRLFFVSRSESLNRTTGKAFRHGDIEGILEDLVKVAGHAGGGGLMGFAQSILQSAAGGKKFSRSDIKKVYFVSCLCRHLIGAQLTIYLRETGSETIRR